MLRLAAAIAALSIATPAFACVTLSDEMMAQIAENHARDRIEADAVVIGTWINDQGDCDEEGNCGARLIVKKVLRGPSRSEFTAYGIVQLGICDVRSIPPETGAYGKYYLERGGADGPYRLVEFVPRKRKAK